MVPTNYLDVTIVRNIKLDHQATHVCIGLMLLEQHCLCFPVVTIFVFLSFVLASVAELSSTQVL
jgi:hypothetical protein